MATAAESVALKYIIDKFDAIVTEEKQLLRGVPAAIKDLKKYYDSMKSYLRDVDAGDESEGRRTLVQQMREIAYDIEDIFDESEHHVRQIHGSGFVKVLQRWVLLLKQLPARHRIATQIRKIKNEVRNLSLRRENFTLNIVDEGKHPSAKRGRLHDRHLAALFTTEAEVVGIKESRKKLVELLTDDEVILKVISVVGMAGLGKTTLARKVYEDSEVQSTFSFHAWIPVKQTFETKELLRRTINRFYAETDQQLPARIDMMEKDELIEFIRGYLTNRRYVVVFDDVWDINTWNVLKLALPDNNNCSRVLLTTQIHDIGVKSSAFVYDLPPLPQSEAWLLFCKKTFKSHVCPPNLEDISHQILAICDGLPLAIVTIAGILSTKEQTVIEWKTLNDNLLSELANNTDLDEIRAILLMSYKNLPEPQKHCFLYFSIFPKNYPVTCNTLVRLWMAEGFIISKHGKTVEEEAEDYLKNLIDHNMVQVAECYDYGRMRSCRVHDLVHEIIVLKAEEENFSTYLSRRNQIKHETIRRLTIHKTQEDLLANISFSHIRAVFAFGTMTTSFMHKTFSGFKSIRVLDLKDTSIQKFPKEIINLIYLRYLSLRNTRINKLPKCIRKLKYLETLDLKGTFITSLPKSLLRLQNLRHLLAYHYDTGRQEPFYYTYGVKVPNGIHSLRELQKLSYLEANQDKDIVRELAHLTQLRRLGIVKLRMEDGQVLCASIEKMQQLRSFSVSSIGINEFLNLQHISFVPPLLQRLYLRGPLQALPKWVSSLENLVRMRLRGSKLGEDALKILQSLPNLAELTFIQAYDGEQLNCEGGFQKLKILDLEQLENLKSVNVDKAMPNLSKLIIRNCVHLKRVPIGIKELKNLKELHLFNMPEVFVEKQRKNQGSEWPEVMHIQKILCYVGNMVEQFK